MKRISLCFIAFLGLFCACEPVEHSIEITGTLYTDSTMTAPVPNDTVTFLREEWDGGGYIGHARLNADGRFGFVFYRNWVCNYFLIRYHDDTIYRGSAGMDRQRLYLYLGKEWK